MRRVKLSTPRPIVVQTPASEHKLAAKLQATARAGQGESKNNSKKGHQNLKAGNKNGQPKNSLASSKKGKALEAAQAIQQEKLQAKSKAVIAHWQVYCDLLGRETDDVKRYSMAVQFMRDRSSADLDIITPDATVYCAGVLMSYWSKMSKNKGQSLSLGMCIRQRTTLVPHPPAIDRKSPPANNKCSSQLICRQRRSGHDLATRDGSHSDGPPACLRLLVRRLSGLRGRFRSLRVSFSSRACSFR